LKLIVYCSKIINVLIDYAIKNNHISEISNLKQVLKNAKKVKIAEIKKGSKNLPFCGGGGIRTLDRG
jgi:hypothetical protein